MGNMAKAYVASLLQLGHRQRKRRTLSSVALALAEGSNPPWLTSVLTSLWLVYSAEVNLWKMQMHEETTDLGPVSKKQRRALTGTGWLRVRRPPVHTTAEKNRAAANAAGEYFVAG